MRSIHALPALILCAALGAQVTTYIAPAGFKTVEGPANNTIPWWSSFATYQQVHDASDLALVFPGPTATIKGLSFRKEGGNSSGIFARTMDVQIKVGITPVSAATATSSFANNLGPSPVVTLPYTNLSLPAVTNVSTPNPQSWFFPFATPFTYATVSGNLCWELRHKNSTSSGNYSCDAVSGSSGTSLPLIGAGCIATAQSLAAVIGARSLTTLTGSYTNRLDRGAATAPAAMFLGLTAQSILLPGLCSALETPPVVTFNGTTDATGTWSNGLVLGNLTAYSGVTLFAQFAFLDAGLTHGFGLSDCGPTTLATTNLMSANRVYASSLSITPGNELATTGTLSVFTALVTGFDT